MPVQQLTLTLNPPNIYFAQTTHRNRKQLYVKPHPSALDMTLPAFAAEHGRMQEISIDSWYATPAPAAVDRYLLRAERSAANHTHAAAAIIHVKNYFYVFKKNILVSFFTFLNVFFNFLFSKRF